MVAGLIRNLHGLAQPKAVGGHGKRGFLWVLARHAVVAHNNGGIRTRLPQQQFHVHFPLFGGKDRIGDVGIAGGNGLQRGHGAFPIVTF